MASHEQKLPWDLTEEILSRVPPKSLVRFRTVSKQWNALFDDKTFINNHKMTFRFILATKSKIYSVCINPKIGVSELTLDIPGCESHTPKNLVECNGILLSTADKGGAVVCNPWLRQTRWIEPEVNEPSLQFNAIGYKYGDRRLKESGYKSLVSYHKDSDLIRAYWKIFDFASNAWKDQELGSHGINTKGGYGATLMAKSVSLNGTLYWVASCRKIASLFYLAYFDFSMEKFYQFCDLPCEENHCDDALVLRVFKEDQFSLLKQCHLTMKVEIWVTKNKIRYQCGGDVEWIKFMEVSIPNFPKLLQHGFYQPSYFIDDKKLFVCFCDERSLAWIYVMGDNKLISKTQIDSVVDAWPLHCTFFPSLVPLPRGQREEAESQV